MKVLTPTIKKIIEFLNPSEILVSSSNYLQCIIDNNFCEFQFCYTEKKWYQFKTIGKSDKPEEIFLKWIELSSK